MDTLCLSVCMPNLSVTVHCITYKDAEQNNPINPAVKSDDGVSVGDFSSFHYVFSMISVFSVVNGSFMDF